MYINAALMGFIPSCSFGFRLAIAVDCISWVRLSRLHRSPFTRGGLFFHQCASAAVNYSRVDCAGRASKTQEPTLHLPPTPSSVPLPTYRTHLPLPTCPVSPHLFRGFYRTDDVCSYPAELERWLEMRGSEDAGKG